MSLTSKIAGLAVALVLAATIAFGLLVQRAAEKAITAREGDRLIYGVSDVAQKLNQEIETAVGDVDVAASTAAIKGLVRALENGGVDPIDGVSATEWKKRVAENFATLLAAEKGYLAIDLIGVSGREILKVERTRNGNIRVAARLTDHGNAAFFRDAIKQPIGTPYISNITPADVPGRGDRPIVDISTAVPTADGGKFGILKITLECTRLIARLKSFNDRVSKIYMTTLDGRYVINPDAARGGKQSAHIQDDHPWLAPAFQSGTIARGEIASSKSRAGTGPDASTSGRPAVYPEGKSYSDKNHVARTLCVSAGAGPAKRTWVIIGVIDTHVLIQSMLRFQRYLAAIVVALALISLLVASVLARRITRPISRLTEAAKRLTQGELDTKVQLEKGDDKTVVELETAFTAMQDAVRTRERRLNDARARIEAIFNSASSAIITVDAHGTILQANNATGRLFGYDLSSLTGQKLSVLSHDSYVDSLFETSPDAAIIGKPREILASRADGTTFPAEISVSKMGISGAGGNFVVLLTDLSERKRYEELDNQLKLERIKGEFVSTVSHELRTPLTSINGSLALLKSDRIGPMPPNAKPLINIAHSNVERLMRLINDILDIEKIKSGTLQFVFEELDVSMLLYQAARANAAYAEQLDVKIKVARVPQGILIMGDPDRIAQALANLISNAAKFSPKGGTILLSAKRKGDWVRISVTDKGCGIPKEFRDRVFSRFAQADSTDARQKGGSGLGLSITKAIAEAHSGKVGFTTATGKGTTFFIDLPLMATAAGRLKPEKGSACGAAPSRTRQSA
jgi:PAS domain S-box-containing protein